jgi:hypothetical protein
MSAVTQADNDDLIAQLENYKTVYRTMWQAIAKLHAAKGRYHTQIAACELFELCGLPAERPKK